MTKDRFASSPFADVRVSDLERHELINLADIYVEDYIEKYEEFVVTGKRRVDKHRWQHVKSKDNLHVYTERNRKVLSRAGMTLKDSLSATQQLRPSSTVLNPPVVLSVGTFSGELDDLMYGVVNPTLDDMRIKASYVHGFGSAAALCSVLEPTKKDPFRSIVIKWIAVDMPLQSTNLVKSRDFVFIEATGTTYLSNGDRIGYHLLHSIEFPQTKPLPNKIRGNLSMFGCFKRKHRQVIENFAWGIVDAGAPTLSVWF
uniref:START domain-containing protein n=1 Tax=Phytophthora ramorum TaxID=164328 RepID=H3GZN7_PHYRM